MQTAPAEFPSEFRPKASEIMNKINKAVKNCDMYIGGGLFALGLLVGVLFAAALWGMHLSRAGVFQARSNYGWRGGWTLSSLFPEATGG